jgi:hypothetical protein
MGLRVRVIKAIEANGEEVFLQFCTARHGEGWVAMILPDGDAPPAAGQVKGRAFFGATPEEAESQALDYLDQSACSS